VLPGGLLDITSCDEDGWGACVIDGCHGDCVGFGVGEAAAVWCCDGRNEGDG